MSALSQNVRPLPKSLSYYVSRVAGFRRQTIKVLPQGTNAAQASSTLNILLPQNSLVDLSTFAIFGYITGLDNTHYYPRNLDQALVQNLQITVGGQQICSIQNYNQLMETLLTWNSGYAARGRRSILQFADGMRAASASDPVAIEGLLPLTGFKPTVIDTGLLGDVVITITLAPSAIVQKNNVAGVSTYTLSSIYAAIDLISFVDDSYSRLIREYVEGGGVLEIPFTSAYGYSMAASAAGQNSSRFVISANSIDMLVSTVVNEAYNTSPAVALPTATMANSYYFTRVGSAVSQWAYTVNGSLTPAFYVPYEFTSQHNVNALCQAGDLHSGSCMTYTDIPYNWATFLRLNADLSGDEPGRYLSGLDTRSTNAQMEWLLTTTAGSLTMFTWALMTSVLRVGAGRQVELVI